MCPVDEMHPRMTHKQVYSAGTGTTATERHVHSMPAIQQPTYAWSTHMQMDYPGGGDRWVLAIYSLSPTTLGIHWHAAAAMME